MSRPNAKSRNTAPIGVLVPSSHVHWLINHSASQYNTTSMTTTITMYRFLILPLVATAANLLLAVLFFHASPKVSASSNIPVRPEEIGGDSTCLYNNHEEDSCGSENPQNISADEPIFASDDPSLQQMPGRDFKAYVVPDVATFYKQEPGTLQPSTHRFNGQAGKFINMTPDRLSLYWYVDCLFC